MLVPVAILPFLAADVANIGLPVRLLHVLRHLRLGAKLFAVIAPLEVRNVFLVVGVFQHLELGVKLLGALRARRALGLPRVWHGHYYVCCAYESGH